MKYKRGFRDEMIASVSLDTTIPRRLVRQIADGLLYELTSTLIRDGKATIENIGTWRVLSTPSKRGRDFKTGNTIIIPRRFRVKFIPSKILLERINRCRE